jgi:hypothetical protein
VWSEQITPSALAEVNKKAGMVEVLSLQSLKHMAEIVLPASEQFATARQKLNESPSLESKKTAIEAAKNAQLALGPLDQASCQKDPSGLVCKKSAAEKALMAELLIPSTTKAILRSSVELEWNKELRNVVGRFQVFDHKSLTSQVPEEYEMFDFCVEDLDTDSQLRYASCQQSLRKPKAVRAFLKREADIVKIIISAELSELFRGESPRISVRQDILEQGSFSEIDPQFIGQSNFTASLEIVRTPLYRGLKGDVVLTSKVSGTSLYGTVSLTEDNPLVRITQTLAKDLQAFAAVASKP